MPRLATAELEEHERQMTYHGRTCSICLNQYFRESEVDPAEPCVCGQMADGRVRDWDGWRGVRNHVRYRIAGLFMLAAEKLYERSYR